MKPEFIGLGVMGYPMAGQLTKMVNQTTVVGLVRALAEGLNFALRASLDANGTLPEKGCGRLDPPSLMKRLTEK